VQEAIRYLTVDESGEGQRLDNFLFKHLKGVPKTHVYRIIRSGEVRRNKSRVQADSRLDVGDELRIPPIRVAAKSEPSDDATLNKPGAPLLDASHFPILFEDDEFLAINKPAGIAVHGGSGVSLGVIEQLRRLRPQAKFLELVHRLDRDTSGILLVAKKKRALKGLQDQFRARQTGKVYLTLVQGAWQKPQQTIDAALQKYTLTNGERRVRVVPKDHPDAMASLSVVKLLKVHAPNPLTAGQASSLLAVTIKTGRTHQIRVHMAHAGHVIAGDDKYGDFDWNKQLTTVGLRRMFLHAWRLQLAHPVTAQPLQLQCELPPDLLVWAKGVE
jgi:23S rRNA pseudouridine955/2504/2580 synthase